MGAKAIKLGSWDKHLANCWDKNRDFKKPRQEWQQKRRLEILVSTNRPVGTAFKLRQRTKNLLSVAHVLHKTLNLVISHRIVWLSTVKKCTKIYNARAVPLFFSLNPVLL